MPAKIRTPAIAILLLGAWGALVPFVGPLFGYNMGNIPAWTWTESHLTLHLIPGVVAIVGGVLMLGTARPSVRLGAVLALLGGAWFILAPTFHPAWAGSGGDGMTMMGGGVWSGIASALGYHYGTGVLILALAAYARGVLANQARADGHPAAAGRDEAGATVVDGREPVRVR